jgi:hypothetical protein
MFAGVGVRIDWRRGQQAESQLLEEGAIAVRVTTSFDVRHTLKQGYAEELKPNSGAFAFPNEGIHITVLYDRLAWSEKMPGFAHVLLAHVLVHEITHMLQGICRHSTAGIMKANWTLDDYYDMQAKTIPFASEDVELIQKGMNQRHAGAGKLPHRDSSVGTARFVRSIEKGHPTDCPHPQEIRVPPVAI